MKPRPRRDSRQLHTFPQRQTLSSGQFGFYTSFASNELTSAEDNDKDPDNRHRAAIALMVYLSTDGIKGKWSAQLYFDFPKSDHFPRTDFSL